MIACFLRTAAGAALLLAFANAHAQPIADPTRPPPAWIVSEGGEKAPEKSEGRTEGSGGEAVQLLLVGKTRRYAIVRGDLVGEKPAAGGARIVEIKRNDLVVNSERGRETLNLFPDVQKTPPRKPAGMGNREQK